jgi:hypothetical protein
MIAERTIRNQFTDFSVPRQSWQLMAIHDLKSNSLLSNHHASYRDESG